jgi:hypothetical protein
MADRSRPLPARAAAVPRATLTQEIERVDAQLIDELRATPSDVWQAMVAQLARALAPDDLAPDDPVVPDLSPAAKALLAAELAHRGRRIEALFERRRKLEAMETPDRLQRPGWAEDGERRAARSVDRLIGPARGWWIVAIAALVLAVAALVLPIALRHWDAEDGDALRQRIELLEREHTKVVEQLIETNRNLVDLRDAADSATAQEQR